MATAVAPAPAAVAKRPSIKKYKAPTPPRPARSSEDEALTDSQNNLVSREVNDNDAPASECKQKQNDEPIAAEEKAPSNRSSPIVKRPAMAPKLNGHNEDAENGSVLSKAALFEGGSPFQRDPTTMSIRERKALFEKHKGAAIVPKAPFGQAPSAKMLRAGNKETPKPVKPLTASTALSIAKSPSKSSLARKSREDLSAAEGGVRGKLQALLHSEQTISEAAIADKNKRERQKELEMLQNRFHYKARRPPGRADSVDSDSDAEAPDASERAPLMGSSVSLHPAARRDPPAPLRAKCKSETALHSPERDERDAVAPPKRRSSQDSPTVLSVLEDVRPVRSCAAAPGLYPRLADIHSADEDESCGSRCGHYALECVFFFLCI